MNKKAIHINTNFSPLARDVSKRQSGIRLKVCGMKFQENIEALAGLQPDYMGFIFYEKSARFFNGVMPELPKNIKKTGVFVNASLEYILEKVTKYNLQAVQLHGDESPEFCLKLRALCHSEQSEEPQTNIDKTQKLVQVEIIKVFSIKDTFDFSILQPYKTVCDYYLFDTKGKLPGGNGYTFNWEVLKDYPATKPYFLSGGIGLDDVEKVLSFLQRQESNYCCAIDVNSKFEIESGLKDIEKLKEFKKNLSFLPPQESS